ncbi:uncharacterized protein TNCV_1018171 [Trichonephila clavipes]|nr:uncharacterized protein TNCV_1018171 [Trichonephila clavipes]
MTLIQISRQLTEFERGREIGLREGGFSFHDIAKRQGLNASTVHGFYQQLSLEKTTGLPSDTKAEDIRNDLIDLGFPVDRVTQLVGNISKQLIPVFPITLTRNIANAKIFDLNKLSYLTIRVQCFESRGLTQCLQCNKSNHNADNCHLTPRCLKCGDAHQIKECQIKRVETLFCINYQTYDHMVANYSKCPLFPKPRKGNIIKSNYSNIVNSLVRPNTSNAQITQTSLNSTAPQQMAPHIEPVLATKQPKTQDIFPTQQQGNSNKKNRAS